jgi:hypothetical protein
MKLNSRTGKHNDQVWELLGTEVLAPLLHDFARWLHRQALQDGVDQLFFMARDGYMLQRAYQAVIPEQEQLPNYYMHASRRMFNFPTISTLDDRAMRFLIGDRAKIPVGQYLDRIGLDTSATEAAIKAAGFSGAHTVVKSTNFDKLKSLFEKLEPQVLASAEIERSRLLRYAKSLAEWDGRRSAVIDVGWHGSMQISLRQALELPAYQLRGYYFGLHTGIEGRGVDEIMTAYLDETRLADWLVCWLTFRRSREIFEIFFTGREASIIGIEETAPGQFKAVREMLRMPGYVARNLDIMQNAAMGAVRQANLSRGQVLRRLVRLMSWPTRVEADALGGVPHMEGFGGYGRSAYVARPRYGLLGYLRRMGQLVHDLRKTFWRPGFIRRLW